MKAMRIGILGACMLCVGAAPAERATETAARAFRDLAEAANAGGAGAAAAEASALALALEGSPPEASGPAGDPKAERDFARRLQALRAKHLDAFLRLHAAAGSKGAWREQALLAGPLSALGVEDPKTRKALGMRECPGVGWCWTVKTPHYEIVTNLAPATQLEVAEAAEDTFEAFTALFRPHAKLPEPKGRFVMYYFDTRDQLLDYCKALHKDVGFGYGVYLSEDGNCYFRTDLELFGLCGVVYHEGTHQLHDRLLGRMGGSPAWVTEGLASYFETLVRRDGKLVLGSEGSERVWHLGGARYIPMPDFLDAPQSDWASLPDRHELTSLNPQYGQAALLTRYFMEAEDGKLRERFLKEIVVKSCGTARDIRRVFGFGPEELAARYVEFANRHFLQPVSLPD